MANRIVIAGSLAQKPRHGGHTWVLLQYLLGLQSLGWDVLFLDHIEPKWCLDGAGRACRPEDSINVRYVMRVMHRFGLTGSYALFLEGNGTVVGPDRREVLERAKHAALLLNVMGFLQDESILAIAPRRVFLDIDPGFGQMWRELGLADVFVGHDDFVTIGENIGRPGCPVPTCGLRWLTTRQPVVLSYWPATELMTGGPYTSVATWRGAYGPVAYQGKTYGLRVHEFRKFARLPSLVPDSFQLVLDIDPADARDLELLRSKGWSLLEPSLAGDPWAYQRFIAASKGEIMIAKNMYVQTQSGWFSDRSVCYLASGKPVLAQDCGFKGLYPTDEGLVSFTTPEQALAGLENINCNYTRHARAARALAEEYFDARKVLSRLLSQLGVA